MEEGIPVFQDYSEFEIDEEAYVEPEFYVDQFYDQNDFDDLDEDGSLSPFSFAEILEHCIEPTVTDGFKHMSKILIWSLIFRISTQSIEAPPWTKHAASIVTGTILASNFFNGSVFFLLTLVVLGYLVLAISPGYRGPTTAALIISFNVGCESWLSDPIAWHQVRGAVMICSMKIISVGFDLDYAERTSSCGVSNGSGSSSMSGGRSGIAAAGGDNSRDSKARDRNGARPRMADRKTLRRTDSDGRREMDGDKDVNNGANEDEELKCLPGWFEFAGYCLCPGTVVLGPWVPFHQYRRIFINPSWNLNWLVKILFTLFFSFMFLTISTCWNPWLIPDSGWKWWLAYRDAMSFRASHYFVSFMSEASAITAGFGAATAGGSTVWQMQVTQPHNIEVPRSLVEIVVSWNVPMHAWLKKYVFKQARKSFGPGVAIFATYGASTLLHGMSAQLAAVLLSLGLYTWVEHSFRGKLAKIMDASIETKRDTDVKFKHREGTTWVILVNMLFGLLSMFHLAYLGVMFDQSAESSSGYSWLHTLAKWRNLDFTSHYVVGVMLLVNWML